MYVIDSKTAYIALLIFTVIHMSYAAYKRRKTGKKPQWLVVIYLITAIAGAGVTFGVYRGETTATWYQVSFWTFYSIMMWATFKILWLELKHTP